MTSQASNAQPLKSMPKHPSGIPQEIECFSPSTGELLGKIPVTRPEEVKKVAHEAGVGRLVLTHLFTDEHLDELTGYVQEGLECEVILGADHMTFTSG